MKPTQTQVRRMEPWEAEEAPQLPAVRKPEKNFVAPLPPPVSSTFAGWQPAQPHELQAQHSVAQVVSMETSHVDRAKGFAIVTLGMSVVVGVFSVVAAIVLFNRPFIAATVLGWFFTSFMLTWLAAYIWYQATSPDGVTLFQLFGGFRLVRHEQKFRHEFLRHANNMPTPQERRHQRRLERRQKGRR
jgi:hypothetical protein